jgi:hypothetical protein
LRYEWRISWYYEIIMDGLVDFEILIGVLWDYEILMDGLMGL